MLHGLYEIPVSGCYDYPLMILDSWGFRYAEDRKFNEDDYVRQFRKMISYFTERKMPGILNIYADPSQVYDWPAFLECMKQAAESSVPSYEHVIEDIAAEQNDG